MGNPVAFVVAETTAQAKDAAELIEVDYEPLPAVTSIAQAKAPGASVVWQEAPGNVIYTLQMGNKAAVDEAFAKAAHVERLTVVNNRVSANAMEPRASIGIYEPATRRYTLYMSSQGPHRNKQMISSGILHIPESDLRVISRDVGGGFGMKGQGYPEDPLVVWAAGKLERPVKWTADRSESLQSDTHGRDQVDTIELAIDKDGKFLALRAQIEVNLGSFISGAGNVPPLQTLWMLSGVYAIPAIFGTSRTYFSHTNPVGTYRGAGRPEASYMIERVIDQAARALKMDPAELRRRNLIPTKSMPYKTAHGPIQYDSGEFETVLDMALAKADRKGFAARRADSEKRGKKARLRHRLLHRDLERVQRAHGAARGGRRLGGDLRRHVQPRPGPRDGLRAAHYGVARRAVRKSAADPGRHRRRRRRARHVRRALGLGRRHRAQEGGEHGDRQRQEVRRPYARGGGRRHRVRRRHVQGGGHRPQDPAPRRRAREPCAGGAARQARHDRARRRRRRGRGVQLPQRLPYLRGRGRSRRPAASRSCATSRSTTSAR